MSFAVASTLAYLNKSLAEAFKRINAMGFEGVEIYYEGRHNAPAEKITDDISIYDQRIYLHAPFSDLNIASFNKNVLDESKRLILESLETASLIGAEITTIHFGRYSPLGLSYPEEAVSRNRESVKEIIEHADDMGVGIAFENAPRGFGAMYGSLSMLEELVEDTGIKITLDVGHSATWESGVENFINILGESIAHVHLHDNTGNDDKHLAIGNGSLDLKMIFKAFKDINYKSALCIEVLDEKDLEVSREKLKWALKTLR